MDDHVLNDVLNDDGNNYMNEALRGRGSPRYWFVRDCLKFYGRVILVRALGYYPSLSFLAFFTII